EPGGVAELEGDAEAGRELMQEIFQPRRIAFEKGRQLEEERTELVLPRARRLAEIGGEVGRIAQAQLVRDTARRLQRERELIGNFLRPALQLAHAGGAVERVIDLHRREAAVIGAQRS